METSLAPARAVAMVDSEDAVAALGHPERRRILQALAVLPDSASGLAERFDDTRQRMNYHVRALNDAGLIELAEERPRRGLTERIYRPVGRGFAIDPSVLGPLDIGETPEPGDRWAAAFAVALASRTTREITAAGRQAEREGQRLAVASMDTTVRLRSPKALEALVDELALAVGEVVARHDDPGRGSRPFRVTTCTHPAPDAADGADNSEE